MHFAHPGWDTDVYVAGMHSVHIGHDPYADATALQQLEHSRHPDTPDNLGPFSYVYSPITLPLLRLLGNIPLGASACLYFLCYIAGVLSELIVGASLIQPSERRYFLYWAPVAVFFPGIMVNDTVLSGNIAFILYGAALAAAACAWRGGSWRWFYLVVLIASCFKAPLLVLLAIPVFSARRQWVPAGLTGAAGVLLFALQPLIWPALFRNYLLAISLQFSLNRDFGSSPAGLFSGVLYDHHLPYSPASTLFRAAFSRAASRSSNGYPSCCPASSCSIHASSSTTPRPSPWRSPFSSGVSSVRLPPPAPRSCCSPPSSLWATS
jgi:hypothetical protein